MVKPLRTHERAVSNHSKVAEVRRPQLKSLDKMYTSQESIKSARSIDQRVICELKNLIRNSSEKNCDSVQSL